MYFSARMKEILGGLAILCSAFFFYLATVIIRVARLHVEIDPLQFVIARFVIGALVFSLMFACLRRLPRPREYRFLFLRIITNFLAVYFFFIAVGTTSAAEANILNMTYPVFIAIISFLFYQHKGDWSMLALGPVAFVGITLVGGGVESLTELRSFAGLLSGLFAAVSIIFLNITRIKNDTNVVLFYLFTLGFLVSISLGWDLVWLIDRTMLPFLGLSALAGIVGQLLLTHGYRYVTALEGSILSSSRILLAAFLGPIFAGDPELSTGGFLGAVLIFVCNVFIAVRKYTAARRVALPTR